MKEVKIKKAWLKSPSLLLGKVGAVDDKQAFPSEVYISKEDYQTMRKELLALGKKQRLRGRGLIMAVNMELLNLGPNESLSKAVRSGYVLVDVEAIENLKNPRRIDQIL